MRNYRFAALAVCGVLVSAGCALSDNSAELVVDSRQLTRAVLHEVGLDRPVDLVVRVGSPGESDDVEVESDCAPLEDAEGRVPADRSRMFVEGGAGGLFVAADEEPHWRVYVSWFETSNPQETLRRLRGRTDEVAACGPYTARRVREGEVLTETSVVSSGSGEIDGTPIHTSRSESSGTQLLEATVSVVDISGDVVQLSVSRIGTEDDHSPRSMLARVLKRLDPEASARGVTTDAFVPNGALSATDLEFLADRLPGADDPTAPLDTLVGVASDGELFVGRDGEAVAVGIGSQTVYRLHTDTGYDGTPLPDSEQGKRPWHLDGLALVYRDDGDDESTYLGHWEVQVLLIPDADTRDYELERVTRGTQKWLPDETRWEPSQSPSGLAAAAYTGEIDGLREVAIIGEARPYVIKVAVSADADESDLLNAADKLNHQVLKLLARE